MDNAFVVENADAGRHASADFARLFGAARKGSRQALGDLLELYRDYLSLVAEAHLDSAVRPKTGVSDVVQESMLDAQRDFAAFRGRSEAELRAWLKRILLHNLLNQHRAWKQTKKRRIGSEVAFAYSRPNEAAGDDPTPSQIVLQREQESLLEQALAKLPEHYRRVIVLRHRDGRSFAQIGLWLNRSPDAARMLWTRAFHQLALELEKLDATPSTPPRRAK